jgi:hypothetical protein
MRVCVAEGRLSVLRVAALGDHDRVETRYSGERSKGKVEEPPFSYTGVSHSPIHFSLPVTSKGVKLQQGNLMWTLTPSA